MTPQQQPQDTITPDEIGAEWGMKLGAALLEKIDLRKRMERLTTITNEYVNRIRELEAELVKTDELAEKTEAHLHAHIQDLEAKISEFTEQEFDFVDHIQALESELEVMKIPERETDNPHAMSEAAEGRTIIVGAKEKAAPLRDGSANL